MLLLLGLISGLVGLGVSRAVGSTSTDLILTGRDVVVTSACDDVSRSNPRWEITKLVFTSIDYRLGGTKGDIRFEAHNMAVDSLIGCVAENVDFAASTDIWYNCSVPGTSFQFSLATFDLRVRGTWECSGSPPTKFMGSGTLDSSIMRCDDYPDEVRGWESVCMMSDGVVTATLTPAA